MPWSERSRPTSPGCARPLEHRPVNSLHAPDFMRRRSCTEATCGAWSTYKFIKDHLGSPRLVVDTSTGARVQQLDYDEWGDATIVYESIPSLASIRLRGRPVGSGCRSRSLRREGLRSGARQVEGQRHSDARRRPYSRLSRWAFHPSSGCAGKLHGRAHRRCPSESCRSTGAGTPRPCSRRDKSRWHAVASHQPMTSTDAILSWGDLVRVKPEAPRDRRPGALADIVGIRTVENELLAAEYGTPVGSKLYLVEFADGSSLEVPGCWLEYAKADSA